MDFLGSKPGIGSVVAGKTPASSMSFHGDGKRLFVASQEGNSLQVIDCMAGKAAHPTLRMGEEHIRCVSSTHHDHSILFAGEGSATQTPGLRYAINYHSTHDNKILRKFRKHADVVTNLSMSPVDDTFLSCSRDRTVCLWTLQSAGCLADCTLPVETVGTPLACFDSTGMVFSVAAAMPNHEGYYCHLYDARNYASGAFSEFQLLAKDMEAIMPPVAVGSLPPLEWTSFAFNAAGNQILIGTNQGSALLLDGFTGGLQHSIGARSNRDSVVRYSSDDQYVLEGLDNGNVAVHNALQGSLIHQSLTPEGHVGPVTAIGCNPRYQQFASCSKDTALWIWP